MSMKSKIAHKKHRFGWQTECQGSQRSSDLQRKVLLLLVDTGVSNGARYTKRVPKQQNYKTVSENYPTMGLILILLFINIFACLLLHGNIYFKTTKNIYCNW